MRKISIKGTGLNVPFTVFIVPFNVFLMDYCFAEAIPFCLLEAGFNGSSWR